MESLRDILEARHRVHKERELEKFRLERKQKSEIRLREIETSNIHKVKYSYFNLWKSYFKNPWDSYVKIIVRFLRYVRFWRKSPNSGVVRQVVFSDNDEDIIQENLLRYEQSRLIDQAREVVPIIFWANTCLDLRDDFVLEDYINRSITVEKFKLDFSDWKSHKTLLFWVKVHSNALSIKIPSWVRLNNQQIIELSQNFINELSSQIIRYEKHCCPQCDSMFLLEDMVDIGDFYICIGCNTMRAMDTDQPYGECFSCNRLGIVKLYDGIPVCEICARRDGFYVVSEDEMQRCPGCNNNFRINEMFIHSEGMHFCKNCAPLAGIVPLNENTMESEDLSRENTEPMFDYASEDSE